MTDQATTPLTGILPAIAAAMGDVQKVSKGDRNTHDGYDFASIDNFLSLVNPICARHGLIIFSDELEREEFNRRGRNGESPWMRVTFSFTVHHVSGQSLPSMRRSVEVMRNGAQAYGSAQSYCLKQFLRGLFLIPTGDKDDADFERKDDGEIVQRQSGADFRGALGEEIEDAKTRIAAADGIDALRDVWASLGGVVKNRPEVIASKDARKSELETPAAANADLAGDEIPY